MESASSAPPAIPTYTQFPLSDNKYFCCCGIHVLKGAKIVGIIQLVLFAVLAVCTLLVASPFLLIPVCLLYGVEKQRAGYMIPWMVFTVFSLGFRIFLFWVCVLGIVDEKAMAAALMLIPVIGSFGLDMWQLITVFRCYGYLCDVEEHIRITCSPRHDVYNCPPYNNEV